MKTQIRSLNVLQCQRTANGNNFKIGFITDTWCTKQEKEHSANLDGIEAVVHNGYQEIDIHRLHFLDAGCD